MSNQYIGATITDCLTEHTNRIAADESVARKILTGQLKDYTKKAVYQAIETIDNKQEYGFSTAVNPKTGNKHTGEPTQGYTPNVAPTGIPISLIETLNETTIDEKGPYPETSHRYSYEDLIAVHTHPIRETGNVGLSGGDLKDDIYAGNHLSRSIQPFDIYRAKAAIVFADDTDRIPRSSEDIVWSPTSGTIDNDLPLANRPQIRPWLHLIERTHEATTLTESEAKNVHNTTLGQLTASTPDGRYQEARNRIDDYIESIVIPLSP